MQAQVLARHLGAHTDHTIDVPRIILMTDDDRLDDPSPIIPSLPPGSAVIIRSKSETKRVQLAHAVSNLCQRQQVILLVSCETPPKQLIGDGVHIPEAAWTRWRRTDFWRLQPRLVTTSAHNLAAARRAALRGVNAVLLSPIHPTKSHPSGKSLGIWRGAAICQHIDIPTIALGGIDQKSMSRALDLGFFGCAGIGIFQTADAKL